MGATRKHRNRHRNLTRGKQQYKLARRYVRAELKRQIQFALQSPEAAISASRHGVLFRCHPQFGWCELMLSCFRRVINPRVNIHSKVTRVVLIP